MNDELGEERKAMICSSKPLLRSHMKEHLFHLSIHVCLVLIAAAIFPRQSLHVGIRGQTLSTTHT